MRRVFALAVAGALTLAACGDDESTDAATTPAQEVTEETVTDDDMSDDDMSDDDMSDDMADDMSDDDMSDDDMADDDMSDDMADDMADDMSDDMMGDHTFAVTIENISEGDLATPLAPGVAVAAADSDVVFSEGVEDFGQGLEALAEDGDPSGLAEAVEGIVFNTPVGASEPGPLLPGESYTVEVEAGDGEYLHLASMVVQTNDQFISPAPDGIAFYEGDAPVSGDITDRFMVWDAGTEADQPFGEGADQAPRQAGPDTGEADPDTSVRQVTDLSAGDLVRVSIELVG